MGVANLPPSFLPPEYCHFRSKNRLVAMIYWHQCNSFCNIILWLGKKCVETKKEKYLTVSAKFCKVFPDRLMIFFLPHRTRTRTPREEIAFSARQKIHSHSQIFRYGRCIFCLPHRPNFSDIFDLCLHWVSTLGVLVT